MNRPARTYLSNMRALVLAGVLATTRLADKTIFTPAVNQLADHDAMEEAIAVGERLLNCFDYLIILVNDVNQLVHEVILPCSFRP